jgi:predicted RNA-binding protein with PIN domain
MRLLVDGMNVIGSRPDGWWRDRDRAVRRLAARLGRLAASNGDDITVVFDGQSLPDLPEGRVDGVRVLYARRKGRNAADDRIVEEVQADDDPHSLTVITSDRELAERVGKLGAHASGARTLLERLDELDHPDKPDQFNGP